MRRPNATKLNNHRTFGSLRFWVSEILSSFKAQRCQVVHHISRLARTRAHPNDIRTNSLYCSPRRGILSAKGGRLSPRYRVLTCAPSHLYCNELKPNGVEPRPAHFCSRLTRVASTVNCVCIQRILQVWSPEPGLPSLPVDAPKDGPPRTSARTSDWTRRPRV